MGRVRQQWLLVTDATPEREAALRQAGVAFRFLSPLEVRYHAPDLTPLSQEDAAVLISSRHAVESWRRHPSPVTVAADRLFIVGGNTAALADSAGLRAGQTFAYLEEALHHMSALGCSSFVHLCGNRTVPEMDDLSVTTGLERIPVQMYSTEYTRHDAGKVTETIALFFSPSGVASFFERNGLPAGIRVGAIGTTTAKALQEMGVSAPFVASHPDFETFVGEMADHLPESTL